jgi:translation elongation factor Ts
MAEITAALVKDLREKSGAGMMDCKKALQENGGDIEAATDWLRTKGLSKAAKKSDRAAAEGLVAGRISDDGKTGVLIELNAETDFVSKNDKFQAAAREIATVALGIDGDVEAISAAKTSGGEVVNDLVTNMIATIGENMRLRRSARLSVEQGSVSLYLHNAQGEGVGRLGVLVALEGAGDQAVLKEVGRKIALHVAGTPTPPLALTTDDLAGFGREGKEVPDRPGSGIRQADRRRREDDRRPHPQVAGGSRPPEAALRHEPRSDDRGTGRRNRQATRLVHLGEGLRALRPGRRRREGGRRRLRHRSRADVGPSLISI